MTAACRLLVLALLAALVAAAPATAAFEGADRTEAYIETADGESLHAEVLRP